jgi:hypothetical protein
MITKQDTDELARIFGCMTAAELKSVSYMLDRAVEVYETIERLGTEEFLVGIQAIISSET